MSGPVHLFAPPWPRDPNGQVICVLCGASSRPGNGDGWLPEDNAIGPRAVTPGTYRWCSPDDPRVVLTEVMAS